ncbi:phosphate-starvation-inducible PsiE family protein [Halomonas sp. MCCC 1A17488]|uniref:Phosphate-starvation-inducible PsiE family protein n=1 Tax=Billgrantia sulfidoxydans TaxID=2733484 RepID=A0ABX7W163_9GAMM|nr:MULTISPECIES: phosphate-starvation-inducible PsiE family protein [Halomonas]MCE8016159.1 phosphate-starvation-inducible PsiE family protein [Halomonas sp. MCCC 1A17488]MCG3239492.1 phosphate-starvation-inducible PsiE family protein [Halomonas sp. MCCC 1A17488]QPP50585.1 phosphate-starvation-inducible PsiE family protein [Halomonas sp. SS10-MC5]QTP54171.1 phosphate-starvation-inducible PsiE family protein [Halomonas sulfidoxydans]
MDELPGSSDKRLPRRHLYHDELPKEHEDPLIRNLHRVIRLAVKVLSVLMVMVIIWGVIDVVYMLYTRLMSPPFLLFEVSDIFAIFSAFMVVLIAIEIFINIRLYLGTNMLPIQLVIATALMAIARKVIIMDTETVTAMEILAIAAVVLALGVTHWLVAKRT